LALRVLAGAPRNVRESDLVLRLIGNDWRVKGLDSVLRAVATLRELPFLVIAAGDDSPGSFRETAKLLGVLERCRFESSREDVLDLYACADLYVSPTLEDSFGLPAAEAMACGLPVLTSVTGGGAELIHDGIDGFILRQSRSEEHTSELRSR